MTDKELAENLRDATERGDVDDIIRWENEIIAVLDLPLEQTEQGLTFEATQAITLFCLAQGVT